MNLLPPPGPERRRLLLMIGTLVVIAAAYWQWGRTPPLVIPTSTGPDGGSQARAGVAAGGQRADSQTGVGGGGER
jgi:hypothetical protein